MALLPNLRITQYIYKLRRRVRSFVILLVIGLVLFFAATALKNLVLNQVRQRVASTLRYERAFIRTFPPALVIEDVRSVSSSPFFSARRVEIKVTLRSLLSRDRPFRVYVENPVLRIFTSGSDGPPALDRQLSLAFPFIVDKGLIRGGELFYWGEETRVFAQGINALFHQSGSDFTLKAEFNENTFIWDSERPRLSGRVKLVLEGTGDDIRIQKLHVVSPGGVIKAKGRLVSLFDPEFTLETSYFMQTPFLSRLFDLPFRWQGRGEGRGTLKRENGEITFQGSLRSRDLRLNEEAMGRVDGRISYQERGGGVVDVNVRRPGFKTEYLQVRFNGRRVDGTARGVYLDAIIKDLEFPWPVASPVWGTFTVVDQRLTADAEFRDELVLESPDRFPFQGQVHLEWDGVDHLEFSSLGDLDTTFARVEVQGNLKVDQDMDLSIRGEVKDASQARIFTELILAKRFDFPEIRGRGQAELRVFGDPVLPQVRADFSVQDAWFDQFSAEAVTGEIELIRESFFGRFEVNDPLFQGRIGLFTDVDETRTEIWLDRGQVEPILTAMDIRIPLHGEASGHFSTKEVGDTLEYEGDFSGDVINFGGQTLSQVTGRIEGDAESVRFPELQFSAYGGRVEGRLAFQPLVNGFDVDLQARDLDLSTLYPSLTGSGVLDLQGKGTFGQEVISGSYVVEDLHLVPFQPTRTEGEVSLEYVDEILKLEAKGGFFPGKNEYTVNLDFTVGPEQDTMTGEIEGEFSNMDLLLPWPGAQAQIDYRASLKGPRLSPEINGVLGIQGTVLPFPRFAHAFRDFSGLVIIKNGDFSIRSIQGRFAQGDVSGSGSLVLGKEGVEGIDVRAEARDMVLSLMERTAARTDGTIRLLKDENRFVLEGDFQVRRVIWRREVTEQFSFASSAYQQPRRRDEFFDDLTLNIRLRASDEAWMDNTLGRLRSRFDLTVSGNIYNPVLFGDIEVIEGNVDLQDRSFDVIQGRISFFNPAVIEPYINFQVETYIKDYRVTVKADGLVNRDLTGLNFEFTSSPPLPPEDVYALISLGESFQRTYQYEQSMGQGTASLLTFTLSEEAEKSARRLFRIDQFRINPYILGSSSEVTARLTVGKRLSRNLFIQYATNLATERKDIVRMEIEISRDLSVVAIRDENGRLSIDLKIHKRF
jgi:hypothetical protein